MLSLFKYNISKFNSFFIIQFLILFPLLLMPSFFSFVNENIFELIKIIEYCLFFLFVYINFDYNLLKKYLAVGLLIFLNIIVTLFYQTNNDFLNLIVRITPLLILFVSISNFKIFNLKILKRIQLFNFFILTLILIFGLYAENLFPQIFSGNNDLYSSRNPYDLFKILGLDIDVLCQVSDNLHNSAYLVVLLFFSFVYQKRTLSYFALFVTFILVLLYQVRTVQVAFFLLVLFYLYFHINNQKIRTIFIFSFSISIVLMIIYLYFNFDYNTINKFSSGRLFVWQERIDILYQRNFLEIIFGTGYGSDSFFTNQWIYKKEPSNSHNDFLTLIFNGGLVSLLLFLFILYQIVKEDIVFGLLIFITSFLSNGFLFRPIHLIYLFFLWKFMCANYGYINLRKCLD